MGEGREVEEEGGLSLGSRWKRKVDCLWGGGLPLGSKLEGGRSVSEVGGKRNDWKRNVG